MGGQRVGVSGPLSISGGRSRTAEKAAAPAGLRFAPTQARATWRRQGCESEGLAREESGRAWTAIEECVVRERPDSLRHRCAR
jgi:hypothetical protein